MKLSPQQRRAVETIDGALLIFAGAGSGKTRVITQRIRYLLTEKKVSPEHILAVTFTNKAAREMKERIEQMSVPSDIVKRLTVSTFHSLGLRIVTAHHRILGYPARFAVYSSYEQVELMKQVMADHGYSREHFSPKMLVHLISRIKNTPSLLTSSSFLLQSHLHVVAKKLYPFYRETMKTAGGVDFDDLLLLPLELFAERPDIAKKYSEQFRYIMVDEYQDTNPVQYRLIKQLSTVHGNICVVGDDDQSIYSWRGAVVDNILNFHHDFDPCTVIKLEENYRSVKPIVEHASQLIAHNGKRADKQSFSSRDAEVGEGIAVHTFSNESAEADFVAREIVNARQAYRNLGSVAVIVRANAQTRFFEMAFSRLSIRYTVIGGQKFFENKESKDLLAYLHVIINPSSSIFLRRVINYPSRGIGTTTQQLLYDEAEKRALSPGVLLTGHALSSERFSDKQLTALSQFSSLIKRFRTLALQGMPPAELVAELVDAIGIRDEIARSAENEAVAAIRLENIDAFISSVAEHADEHRGESTVDVLFDFVNSVALIQSGEEQEEQGGVTIITAHSSKGLEFDTVFLVGMYDGGIPNIRALKEGGLEEERRLCYVAMTRAKKRLYITWLQSVRVRGRVESTNRSRFIEEAGLNENSRFFSKVSVEESIMAELKALRNRLTSE